MAYKTTKGIIKHASGTATTAEVNAGKTIVKGRSGQSIAVVGGHMVARGGAAGTCTSVDFKDTNGTPVVAIAFGRAGLTQNTRLDAYATSNVTLTTFQKPLTIGTDLQIKVTGSDLDTATSVDWFLQYVYI